MARKLTKIVLITIVVLVVITGIVVGILFGVGILKTHKSGSSGGGSPVGPKPSPLGPNVPNPYVGSTVTTTLSNPVIDYNYGSIVTPVGVNFNIEYSPNNSGFPVIPAANWTLNLTVVLTFADGTTNTVTQEKPGAFATTYYSWQADPGRIGLNRNPTNVAISGYLSYTNESGNTINGPVSNTISINVPTNY